MSAARDIRGELAKLHARIKERAAITSAWERGDLAYKLLKHQIPLYQKINKALKDPTCLKYGLNCSRRFGKTTVLCLISMECALKNPGAQIRFAAPTGKALRKIVLPIMRQLLADCPEHLRPTFKVFDQCYIFKNGGEIHLAGTDSGHYESLRGQASSLNVVDEAGFCDDLAYVVSSILMPQTITTGGKTIISSTPPVSPAHDFTDIFRECELAGHSSTFTIRDNTSLTPELVDFYAKEAGGEDSTTFRREYGCEFIVDDGSHIVPEWKKEFIQAHTVDDLLGYYHKYVSMDMGVIDNTAILFGHYNFQQAVLYIEDELTMSDHEVTTINIKDGIAEKEAELWSDAIVYRRVADNNNLILIQDLGYLHGIHFSTTTKDNLHAMINELRMFIASGRLRVNPRCKMLAGCLESAIWDKGRKEFSRSKAFKHFDHLAALVYLVRNIDQNTNPVPPSYNTSDYTHWIPSGREQTGSQKALKSLFQKGRE